MGCWWRSTGCRLWRSCSESSPSTKLSTQCGSRRRVGRGTRNREDRCGSVRSWRAVADLRLPVTADCFLQDFCNWPTGLLPGALQLLDEIPDTYHVAALSNTSAVHWDKIRAMGLVDRFDQTYLSHQIGCLKPATEAFLVALDGMGLSPSDVLFLDDGLRNIDAAVKLGMHAHVARGPEEARRVLAQYGVVPSSAGT